MDRTKEFLKLANEIPTSASHQLKKHPSNTQVAPASRSRPTTKAIQFNQKATQISKGIQTCAMLLARLTTLTRSQNMFSEEGDELGKLSVTVKNEMNEVCDGAVVIY